MLNDLILAHAALQVRPRIERTETQRLSFSPLSPWMIDELRRRAERSREQSAPQVELPREAPPAWEMPVKDWQD